MKKLLTLCTTLLFSFSLWADITWTAPQSADQLDYFMTMDDGASLMAFKNKTGSQTTPEEKTGQWSVKTSNSGGFWIVPAADVSKITISYLCGSTNSSDTKYKIQTSDFGTDLNGANSVEFAVKTGDAKNVWFDAEIVLDVAAGQHLYVKFPTNVYLSRVVLSTAPTCTAPATPLSIDADKKTDILAGDLITFTTAGGNGVAVTIAGADNETITANQWTATLGKHTFTASQDDNDTICGGTAQIELTVISNDPVTSAVISGRNTVSTGDSLVLTCTADNATAFQWYLNNAEIAGATAERYTFRPTDQGTYTFACTATNAYTGTPVRAADFAVTVVAAPLIWQYSGGDAPAVGSVDAQNGLTVEFLTNDTSKTYSKESAAYNAAVPADMKSKGSNGLKLGGSALYLKVTIDNGEFIQGDSVVLCGYRPFKVSSTSALGGDLAASVATGTGKSDYNLGGFRLTEDADALYIARAEGSSTCLAAIQILRTGVPSTEPKLEFTPASVTLKATAAHPVANGSFTVTGKNLTPGTYALAVPDLAGLTVNPTSVTVGDNGRLNAQIDLSYTSDTDVAPASAEISLTLNDLTKKVIVNYSAVTTKQFAKSINIEQSVLNYGKSFDIRAALDLSNIEYKNIDALDSLDSTKANDNYPFLGLKLKKTDASLSFWLQAGSTFKLRVGNVGANFLVEANGVSETLTSAYANATPDDTLTYVLADVTADTYVRIICNSTSTLCIKQIMINEDIQPVTEPQPDTRSGDCTIRSLAVEGHEATADGIIFSYEVPGDMDLAEVAITYVLNDSNATATPASGFKMAVPAVGEENSEVITVYAENLTTKDYMVVITKAERSAQALDSTSSQAPATKRLRDGRLVIERNGQRFNALGTRID